MMNLPDDLNQWSEASFNIIRNLFQKCTSQDTVNACRKQEKEEKSGRTKVLTDDDLMNLKIDLGRINTVDDFLKGM